MSHSDSQMTFSSLSRRLPGLFLCFLCVSTASDKKKRVLTTRSHKSNMTQWTELPLVSYKNFLQGTCKQQLLVLFGMPYDKINCTATVTSATTITWSSYQIRDIQYNLTSQEICINYSLSMQGKLITALRNDSIYFKNSKGLLWTAKCYSKEYKGCGRF